MTRSRRSSLDVFEKSGRWESTEHLPSRKQKLFTTFTRLHVFGRLRVSPRLRRPSFIRGSVRRRREESPTPVTEGLNPWRSVRLSSSQLIDPGIGSRVVLPERVQSRGADQEGPPNPEVQAGDQPGAEHPLEPDSLTAASEEILVSDDDADLQSLTSTLRPAELLGLDSGPSTPTQVEDPDQQLNSNSLIRVEVGDSEQINGSGLLATTEEGNYALVIGSPSPTSTRGRDREPVVESNRPPSPQSTLYGSGDSRPEASTASARFQCFDQRCYAALSVEVDHKLLDIFNKGLRQKIGRALNHSRLEDDRMSIECLMVGEEPSPHAMSPTILFVCLTQAQKKKIIRAMSNLDFRPDLFNYKVVIHKIVKTCSSVRSQSGRNMIGCFVDAGISQSSDSICGTPAKILIDDEKGDTIRSTIGGLIMVNEVVYALTTAHGFADGEEKDCKDSSSYDFWAKNSVTEEPTKRIFTRVGTLHSFEWTGESNNLDTSYSSSEHPTEELISQDWALVDVSLAENLKRENKFFINGELSRVEGYVQCEDLFFGEVWVCSGSQGALRGTLSGSTASLIMGHSTFDVRSVYLDHELVGGDSGSWVIRDGRLCGYIFCRAIGLPMAYMLPIEPVIKEIARVLTNGVIENVQIPVGVTGQMHGLGRQPHVKFDEVEPEVQNTQGEASKLVGSSASVSEHACSVAESETIQTNADLEIVSEVVRTGVNPWNRSFLLSFDGGGVRGLSCLYLLKEVMVRIKDLERSTAPQAMSSFDPIPCLNNANEPVPVDGDGDVTEKYLPCHYFDYMAGTNTGGLIAIMLSRLRMSVDDAIPEFINVVGTLYGKPRIFSMRGPIPWKRPRYNDELLKEVTKDLVARKLPPSHPAGDDKFNSAPDLCKTMVIAYGKRLDNPQRETAYIFRSYPHFQHPSGKPPIRNAGGANSLDIDTVAQATIAAPSYFEPIEVNNWRFGDGGYGCNNPAAEAYFETRALHNESHSAIALLVSLGTGDTDVARLTDQKGFSGRLRQYANAGKVLASDRHGVSKHLRKITDGIENSYYRFNAGRRLGEIKFDEWKAATESRMSSMDAIRVLTEQYLTEKAVQAWIDEIAHILVDNRRKRANLETGKWEEALLGTRWRCEVSGCEEGGKFFRRQELEKHLRSYHIDQEANFQNLILCGKTRLV